MERAHALLSPSGASRWLNCPPSARLEEDMEDTTSQAAEEGTLAHSIAEEFTKLRAGMFAKSTFNKHLRELKKHPLYKEEMLEHCSDYADRVIEQQNEILKTTNDALLELEQKVDISEYVPESFGSIDSVVVGDGLLSITDFKYGKGVKVEAENNAQMRLYALGIVHKYSLLYDVETIRMTIFQPRLHNVSTEELSLEELQAWGESIKPAALQAWRGEGELKVGDHCRFCKVKATCRARADKAMETVHTDFSTPPELTNEEIETILPELDDIIKWAKDVQQYALTQALAGHKWGGFKLVEGRSVRTIVDEEAIANEARAKGVKEEALYTRKLVGITQLQKLVGKTTMSEWDLKNYIVKPEGKPTLVPETDKRPEMRKGSSPEEDFGDDSSDLI